MQPGGQSQEQKDAALSTIELKKTIERSNKITNIQNWIMVALTLVILILTAVLIFRY